MPRKPRRPRIVKSSGDRPALDRLTGNMVVPNRATRSKKRSIDSTYSFSPLASGRQTQPENYNPFGLQGWYFIPKRQYQEIDVETLDVTQFTADQLLAILPDLNPDFSMAVWNYLRTCGTDVKFEALTPNGSEFPAAQRELDDLLLGINPQFGGIDALVRQLLLSVYLQGAACCEAAPTKNLKDLEDIYAVNPDSIWFQRDADQTLVPFQRQVIWGNLASAYPYRMMNEETFFYNPVDAYIDDPYGRAPAAPALQVVFGLVAMLRDLIRVMHQHGFPRVDIELVMAAMEASMPAEVHENEQDKFNWMNARMNEVVSAYNNMAPEDAFIHWDFVSVDSAKTAGGKSGQTTGRTFEPDKIIAIFRDQLIVALKSLPIFHGGGNAKGETETYGTVEYEIYGAAAKTLREIASEVLVRGLTVALQFRGIQATINHEWAPIRTTQRLQDAIAEGQEIENEVNKRDQNWSTQDDASNAITGSEAVGPAPAPSPVPMAPLKAFPQQAPKGATTFPPGSKEDVVPGTAAAPGEPGRGRRITAETYVRSGPGMGLVYAFAAANKELERMVAIRGRR